MQKNQTKKLSHDIENNTVVVAADSNTNSAS